MSGATKRRPIALGFAASSDGRERRRRQRRASMKGRGPKPREQGVALVIAITTVAILSVMLADMHESTGTAFAVATAERDRLQAEYIAKSGHNLTRLLIRNEPRIRQMVSPLYQALIGRPPPQLPIWSLANDILQPFCRGPEGPDDDEFDFERAGQLPDFLRGAQGLENLPGTCEIVAFAENSKINVNDPLFLNGDRARRSISMQMFAVMGGYQSPSPYDPLFQQRDADGQFSNRQDILGGIIDWWDVDTDRTTFDPGAGEVATSGGEDDVYRRLDDPYEPKNAPFDSLEELRLVRGIGDDFWATFVEPVRGDDRSRKITVYGSGSVNPNEAPPEVLLARICSFLENPPLCTDPAEAMKFVQLLSTVRSMFPVPFFTRSGDFMNFAEGRGGPRDLYPMMRSFLGPDSPLLFTPVAIPQAMRGEVASSFVTAAQIIRIHVTANVGRTNVHINSVMNFHDRWSPPPPNAGRMPGLGVFHYYRID